MKKTLLMLALAAGITSFAQNAQAAIVNINIGPTGFNIGGTNGGVSNNDYREVADFPISGNSIFLYNNFSGFFTGLERAPGPTGFSFATGTNIASPVNFAPNALIDSNSNYGFSPQDLFKSFADVSPDFGAGSYMGFRTAQNNYGWLEVTWTASSDQFQILSGAYEDQAGVAILAGAGGAGPAAVPEPGTWAAAALLAGGAAFARWRKRAKVA
jgi:hypothetical protein